MLGSLITGGLSLIGGLFGQKKTDDRLREQMAFQEHMSSTAYQRSMDDMRKAGLNPMLAYQQGGASTPAGASSPALDVLTPAVHTAQAAKRLSAEVDNMHATNENIREQNKNLEAERIRIGSQTSQINATTKILHEELKAAQREAARAEHDKAVYDTPYAGKTLRTLGTILREIGIGGSTPRGNITITPKGN